MFSTTIAPRGHSLRGMFAGLFQPSPSELAPAALPAPPTESEPLPRQASAKAGKGKKRSQSRQASVLEMLAILREARQPLTVSELAASMACSVGEASKRVAAAGKLVKKKREGRCVYVRIAELSMSAYVKEQARLRGA